MKFVSFKFNGRVKVGIVDKNKVYDAQACYARYLKDVEGDNQADKVSSVLIPDDMVSFLRAGVRSIQAAKQGVSYVAEQDTDLLGVNEEWLTYNLDDVKLLPPIRPQTVMCAGPNVEDPADPLLMRHTEFYLKSSHTIIGPKQEIIIDLSRTDKYDVQVELGVVIGKSGRFIPEDKIMDHIFGFTIVHNVINRDRMQVGWEGWMWHIRYGEGASFDNSTPIGPWIVEKNDINNLEDLELKKYINDELIESHNSKDLLRSVKQFVSYCSTFFTLEPGLFISTGSPGGWVLGRDGQGNPVLKPGKHPNRFLREGDRVKGFIEGIGSLENTVKTRSG